MLWQMSSENICIATVVQPVSRCKAVLHKVINHRNKPIGREPRAIARWDIWETDL